MNVLKKIISYVWYTGEKGASKPVPFAISMPYEKPADPNIHVQSFPPIPPDATAPNGHMTFNNGIPEFTGKWLIVAPNGHVWASSSLFTTVAKARILLAKESERG